MYHKKYQSVQHSIQLKILFNNISVFNRFQIPLFKALFNHVQSFIPDQNTNSICIIRETRKTARIQFTQYSLVFLFGKINVCFLLYSTTSNKLSPYAWKNIINVSQKQSRSSKLFFILQVNLHKQSVKFKNNLLYICITFYTLIRKLLVLKKLLTLVYTS